MAISSVLLVAAAFGMTFWRDEHAHKSSQAALALRADRLQTEQASKTFWHQREAINEYLVTGAPDVLTEIDALQTKFLTLTADLADGESQSQVRALARLRTANARLVREFELQADTPGITRADTGAQLELIEVLHPLEDAVLRPLQVIRAGDLQAEQAATRAAASASGQARLVALLGMILALGSVLGFAIYASGLLRHVTRQADELERTLTEREQAHKALREREDELRQAQKTEAVGRLAGGVAHDFNNILLAITGYSDLAIADVRPDQPELRESIDQVKAAAILATALTGKLLAFSRQQVVQPRVVDVNEVVDELGTMLRPLLGETIELVLELEPSRVCVEADPGQLEQVVMNLVINARDAMPEGGQVTIAVTTLDLANGSMPTGRYVQLAVSDTGTGMDEATISRAFDPFFTTKDPGEGTGLGLATVHGIVTQSGGNMQITSTPGEGTTFTINLPRTDAVDQQPATERSQQEALGSETILLVEDVDAVRTVLRKILERNGYGVIAVNGGAEAIESVKALTRPVDLLVTDMVMPGMSGRDLSRELVAICPELRVIFMSGHTQDAALHQEAETGRVDFLQKPFSATMFVETVRQVLDRPVEKAPVLAA